MGWDCECVNRGYKGVMTSGREKSNIGTPRERLVLYINHRLDYRRERERERKRVRDKERERERERE